VSFELSVGIHRHRVTNGLEHREIARRIAVGVALGQVVALPVGDLAHGLHLALAVAEGSIEFAGVHTVDDAAAGTDT
jgi:hypothetical protein